MNKKNGSVQESTAISSFLKTIYSVLFLENVKCFGDIKEDGTKDSLTVPRLKGFISERKRFYFRFSQLLLKVSGKRIIFSYE